MTRFDETIVLRIPKETGQRAEDLIESISDDSKFAAYGKITKSTILRIALLNGLESLEKRYKQQSK